jgi:hypothetical protein
MSFYYKEFIMCIVTVKCKQCGKHKDSEEVYSGDLPRPCRACRIKKSNPKKDNYLCIKCGEVKHKDLMIRQRITHICRLCYNQRMKKEQELIRLQRKMDKIA